MTAVLLGAIRTLINFHSCSGICLVKRYYSQDSLVFWADALILSKKIFFAQGCLELVFVGAAMLLQSTKSRKTNIPSQVGPGSHLTRCLALTASRNWMQKRVKTGQTQRDSAAVWFSAPGNPLYEIAEQLQRYIIWCWYVTRDFYGKERPERNCICQGTIFFPLRWVFLICETPMHIILKKYVTISRIWEKKNP